MRLPLMSQSALSHSNGGLYDGMRNSTEGTSGIGHAVADKLAQVGVSMYQSWAPECGTPSKNNLQKYEQRTGFDQVPISFVECGSVEVSRSLLAQRLQPLLSVAVGIVN